MTAFLCGLLAGARPAAAQTPDLVNSRSARLLYHPIYGHEDYSRQGYRRTGQQTEERLTFAQYDEFGTLLMDGLDLYELRQVHPMPDAINTPAREAGSSLRKSLFYNDYLNRLVVASDSYGNDRCNLVIGDRVRTWFSPLTLDQAMLNGLRLDHQHKQHQLSLVASRADRPIFRFEGIFPYEQGYFGDVREQEGLANALLATYLLGGHYQTSIGALTIGLNYANQFRVDTQVGWGQNPLKGTLPVNHPAGLGPADRPAFVQWLVVKVADETPRDAGGARVYGVDILIDGRPRADIVPVITRQNTRVDEIVRLNRDLNGDRFYPEDRSIPPYVQFLGNTLPHESPGPQGYLEAAGTEYLLYWFAVPADDNHRVSFEALVANDYVISLSEVYLADVTSTEPRQRNAATYFYRAVSSPGRVTDGSNLRRVTFDYGRQTAVTVTGAHATLQAKGLLCDAELVKDFDFRQYPDIGGSRSSRQTYAGYVVARKRLGALSLGGEYFNMPPDFTTTLSVQDVAFTADYTGPYLSDIGNTFNTRYNNTIELNLVDDNDDRDPFPDDHFLSLVRDEDGVFPGMDADFDGRPDINRNNNGVPDYDEPFLLYYVDPDDYTYGDDLNNNGQIDAREDDSRPDYPYDADLRGVHAFAEAQPVAGVHVSLGYYDARQPAAGGIMRSRYAKVEAEQERVTWGRLRVVDDLRRVKDTIPNDIFRYGADRTFGAVPVLPPQERPLHLFERDLLGVVTTFVEDPLLYTNSTANTAYVEGQLSRYAPLQVRANAKYDLNQQHGAGQGAGNRIDTWTSVLAGHYAWRLRGLVVQPEAKVQWQRIDDQLGAVLHRSEISYYPILTAAYGLTPHTTLKAGAQGFPFLPSRHHDYLRRSLGYREQDYIAMATSMSEYSGYQLSLNAGYQVHRLRMKDRSRSSEDIDYGLVFVRVVTGLRPSEGRGG